jgi:thioredoxin-like negative regulator of GroEL
MTSMLCATVVQLAWLLTAADAPTAAETPAAAEKSADTEKSTKAEKPVEPEEPTETEKSAGPNAGDSADKPADEHSTSAETYEKAHDTAIHTGKPIVVMVSTDWCAPCQTMKRTILPRVRKWRTFRKVAFATVNPDRERELAEEITGGGPIPQLVMFHKTPKGWLRRKLVGSQSVEAVEQFIQEGLALAEAEKKAEAKEKHAAPQPDGPKEADQPAQHG